MPKHLSKLLTIAVRSGTAKWMSWLVSNKINLTNKKYLATIFNSINSKFYFRTVACMITQDHLKRFPAISDLYLEEWKYFVFKISYIVFQKMKLYFRYIITYILKVFCNYWFVFKYCLLWIFLPINLYSYEIKTNKNTVI